MSDDFWDSSESDPVYGYSASDLFHFAAYNQHYYAVEELLKLGVKPSYHISYYLPP